MSVQSMTFGARGNCAVLPSAWFTGLMTRFVEMLRSIDRWQLSTGHYEPRNAREVLAWADQIQATDPGFAADLRAAVERSEAA